MKNVTFTRFLSLALKTLAEKEAQDRRDECWLSEKPEELHGAVKLLQEKYKEVLIPLKELHFVTRGAFPYSYELSQSLEVLQEVNAIRRRNPTYDQFAPTWFEDTDKLLEKRRREFFDSQEELDVFGGFVEELRNLRTNSSAVPPVGK